MVDYLLPSPNVEGTRKQAPDIETQASARRTNQVLPSPCAKMAQELIYRKTDTNLYGGIVEGERGHAVIAAASTARLPDLLSKCVVCSPIFIQLANI